MTLTSQTVQAKTHGDTVYLYVSIGGTDEPDDVWITLDCLPDKHGFHRGCSKVAQDLAKQFDEKYQVFRGVKPVRIKGHSMGAGIGELMAEFLERMSWDIFSIKSYGGYGVSKDPEMLGSFRYRAGHDVVPFLFSWLYKNSIDYHIPGDPSAKWPLRFIADHNSYPWREY